jgi:hypothetical protein
MAQWMKATSAKDDFKKLIVKRIEATTDFYSSGQFASYFNSVEMLDCVMVTYTDDEEFQKGIKELVNANESVKEKLKTLMMVDTSTAENAQVQEKFKFYQSYFKALVDLANRTLLAGRDVDVDINLEEVFRNIGDMLKEKNVEKPLPLENEAKG